MRRAFLAFAINQIGHTIERHDGPKVGWVSILETPLTSRDAADAYLAGMSRAPGAEYRVYAALESKS
jgi:hypothetical protein